MQKKEFTKHFTNHLEQAFKAKERVHKTLYQSLCKAGFQAEERVHKRFFFVRQAVKAERAIHKTIYQ